MAKIAVLGAGAWGTALAMNISQRHQVSLWARNAGHVSGMRKARANPLYLGDFKFNDNLQVEDNLQTALSGADLILSVVPTAGFRAILKDIKALACTAPIIWANKGLEPKSAKLPYEVALEELGDPEVTGQHWGALSGPSFAAELVRGLPTAVTLAAADEAFSSEAALLLHGENLRVYHTTDVIGVSVGGAVKNVMAIAAGISDGMGVGNNARAAMITRGLAEMTRFGVALGASPETFMGLAGAGDLILFTDPLNTKSKETIIAITTNPKRTYSACFCSLIAPPDHFITTNPGSSRQTNTYNAPPDCHVGEIWGVFFVCRCPFSALSMWQCEF